MTDPRSTKAILAQMKRLMETAESGDDWAEICRLEAIIEERILAEAEREECADHGQFGVGA